MNNDLNINYLVSYIFDEMLTLIVRSFISVAMASKKVYVSFKFKYSARCCLWVQEERRKNTLTMFCQIEINALFAIAFSFLSTEDRSSEFKTDSSQSIYSRSFQCIIHARRAIVYTKGNVAKWTSLVPVNAAWIEQTNASFYFQNFQIIYSFFVFLKR